MINVEIDRRTLLRGGAVAAGAVAFGGLLSACAPAGSGGGGGGAVTGTVDLWSWVPPELSKLPKVYQSSADRWIADGKGRKYNYVLTDYENYATKLRTAMLSGEPPAIANVNMDQVGAFASSGQVTDLTDWAKKQPKLNQKMVERYLIDGKQYVYWPDVNAQGVIFNKTVFDKLGLSAPKTIDEMATVSAALRKAGYQPLCIGLKETWISGDLWFQGMAYEDPSDELIPKAERGEVKWNAPKFLAAAKYLEKVRDANLFIEGYSSLSGVDGYQVFGTQQAGMIYPGAVWSYDAIATINNGSFEMGLFEMPPLDSSITPRATGGPSSCFVVPSAAKSADAGLDLISFMADPDGQKAFATNGFVPGVVDTPALSKPPYDLFPEFVRIQENAATRSILIPEVTAAMQDSITALWGGRATAQDVVDSMQAAADKAS